MTSKSKHSEESYENESSNGASTFRDTEIEREEANNFMKIQSLSSIVNNPKSESLLRQVGTFIKKSTVKEYKPLKESRIPESITLPKITLSDFQ